MERSDVKSEDATRGEKRRVRRDASAWMRMYGYGHGPRHALFALPHSTQLLYTDTLASQVHQACVNTNSIQKYM
jgi:hypothetical protein